MFSRSYKSAPSRLLIVAICFVLPATSGCAIIDRLDTLNCQASQLVYNTQKLDETNQRLKETNERLAELGEKADSMDKKLATLEKAARRFGGAGVSDATGPAADEAALVSRRSSEFVQGPPRP